MPDPRAPDDAPEPTDPTELAYEPPPELADEGGDGGERRGRRSPALRIAVAAGVVLLVGAAVLAYRVHHRRKVVAAALSQADVLLRLDTAAGYRRAASLLEPIAELDPLQGASVRAFALAMLSADYREQGAEAESEELLVAPGRADVVPPYAHLAAAALALRRGEAGTATTALSRAGDGPWALAMQARVALAAGNLEAALPPAASAAAEGAFPPGLSVHGDVLRRLHRDSAGARAAYAAALAASPGHARAAYGLAKLALSGHAPAPDAEAALRRLLEDRDGTLAPERGRAALHLAALRLRAGDPRGAAAALDAAGIDPPSRAWAERAAATLAARTGPYRAVSGAPAALQSASDDDPGELSPAPPPPPPAAKKAAVKKAVAKKPATKKPSAGKKKAAAKAKATPKKAPAKAKATAKKRVVRKPAATRPAAKAATTRTRAAAGR
jgi:hypothetical protein